MLNNDYRLQILYHEEVFETREKALEYIEDNFKRDALVAEPAVVFYGDKNAPKAIIAVGSAPKRVSIIDFAKVEEDIASLEDWQDEHMSKVGEALAALKNLIHVCGLRLDENRKEDQVLYEPDSKDKVIGDAETLAQAIDLLSKYTQQGFESTKLSVVDTKSVKLTYKDNEENGGKNLKAAVKISSVGEDDDEAFNNNIIGVKSDGLYASVYLDYDEATNVLTFYTSGVKNGKFQNDAVKQTVKLNRGDSGLLKKAEYDKRTEELILTFLLNNGKEDVVKINVTDIIKEWNVNNENHTVTLVKTEHSVDGYDYLSADVNIAEHEDNILEKDGNNLYVSGRSNNIKHKETTVAEALDGLESKNEQIVQDLIKEINNRTAEANELLNKLEQETKNREEADEFIKHLIDDLKIDDLRQLVDNFQKEYGDFVNTWTEKKTEIESILNQAKEVITKTEGRVETLTEGLNALKNDLTTEVERVSGLADKVNTLEGKVDTHITNYDTLNASVTNLTNEVGNEVNRAKGEEFRLETLINANKEGIATNKTNIDGLIKSAAGLRNELDNEVTRAKGEETRIEGRIDSLTDTTTKAVENALEQANAYTDSEILKIKTVAAEDAEVKSKEALEQARIYTDEQIRLESTKREDDDKKNAKTIDDEVKRAKEGEAELERQIKSITIEKNSASDLQYSLLVDGRVAGEINIPEDQFLDDVSYDQASQTLTFTWKLPDDNKKQTVINVSDLMNVYTAGDGLSLSPSPDNKFSIMLSSGDETRKYLSVDSVGLKFSGVDAELAKKADAENTYTQTEVNRLVENEKNRAVVAEQNLQNDIETVKQNVSGLNGRVGTNEAMLATLTANEAQEGSVDNKIAAAKSVIENNYKQAIADAVDTEKTARETKDIELTTKAGNIEQSVERITERVDQNETDINLINSEIGQINTTLDSIQVVKIKGADRYRLVVNAIPREVEIDLSPYAKSTEVEGLTEQVNAIEIPTDHFQEARFDVGNKALVLTRTNGDEKSVNLIDLVDEYKPGNGLTLDDNETFKTFNVKIADSESHLALRPNDGLYIQGLATEEALAELSEEVNKKAETTDISDMLTKTEAAATYQEKGDYALNSNVYNTTQSDERYLKKIDANSTFETVENVKEIKSNVKSNSDAITLLNTAVDSLKFTTNDTDTVSMSLVAEQPRVLQANVRVNNDMSGNIIKFNGNGLYANVTLKFDEATNTLTFNDGNNDTSIKLPVAALNKQLTVVNTENDPVNLTIKDYEIQAKLNISTLPNNLIHTEHGSLFASDQARVHFMKWNGIGDDIDVESAVNKVNSNLDDLIKGDVATLKTDVNDLKDRIKTVEQTLSEMQKDIIQIKSMLSNSEGGNAIINERITALEEICNNLIDFGVY